VVIACSSTWSPSSPASPAPRHKVNSLPGPAPPMIHHQVSWFLFFGHMLTGS
jgi:hypothetical protein